MPLDHQRKILGLLSKKKYTTAMGFWAEFTGNTEYITVERIDLHRETDPSELSKLLGALEREIEEKSHE